MDTSPGLPRPVSYRLTAIALTVVSVVTATGLMFRLLHEPPTEATARHQAQPAGPPRFLGWEKPDLALVLSAQQYGYLQPCGCSRPQLGGLARRYNVIQSLKERGWPVVAVDLGDIRQGGGYGGTYAIHEQTQLKYKTSLEALAKSGYAAVGLGQSELSGDVLELLSQYSLNNPSPAVLAANLKGKDDKFLNLVKSWEVVGGRGTPRVGLVGAVGASVAAQKKQDPAAQFDPVENVLPGVLRELEQQQPDVRVLLLQGSEEEAKALAAAFKDQFHVILCLSVPDEPSEKPVQAGNTWVYSVGHKGRYVGVVGLSRAAQSPTGWKQRYQLVSVGEEFETPEGKEKDNPVHAVMEAYAREVRDRNLLTKFPVTRHAIQLEKEYAAARYAGSEACKKCHKEAHAVWSKKDDHGLAHSAAWASLEGATRPGLRHFDAECVRCHVTGFGSVYGFRDAASTPLLRDVGCEVCHGPGSLHVKGNQDEKLLALMNPFKAKPNEAPADKERRLSALDQFCMGCHDKDNDVNWGKMPFEEKWKKIAHPEAK